MKRILFSLLACVAWAAVAQGKPNIVLIMADDVGCEPIGAYGGERWKTPHIDALAKSGMRFDYAFSMPVCHPTRVCLMTGKYPFRLKSKWGSFPEAEEKNSFAQAGVPFVRVSRAWWDSHGQNFETHQELVPELDRVLAALIDDLKQRGMLDDVLVVTMGEFGRTPRINGSLGRDHFATAWSASLHGCGVKGGAVFGKTDAKGESHRGRDWRRRIVRHHP